MTTMKMASLTKHWGPVQELIDSMGLTVIERSKTHDWWTVVFAEDLNNGQKTQFEARLTHTVSGIDWS